jgi:hypothetical protein
MAKAKKQTTQQTFGASKAATTVAPKANNVTVSTATKNVSSTPAVAPKANNVTAATATKNVSPSAPVTAKYTAPSTPAVSTPTYTAPSTPTQSTPSYTAPSTPSYVAPSNPTPIDVTRGTTLQTPSIPDNPVQSLYDTIAENRSTVDSVQNILNSVPNETPTQRTERWLGNMGILGNANTNVARNNIIRNNATKSNFQTALEDSVRDTLLGENGLYEEVPNVGGGSVYDAILNPTAVIPKATTGARRELSSLEEALANAASDALGNAGYTVGNGTTPGTVFQQILDPERYAQLANPTIPDVNVNNSIDTGDYEGGSSGGSGGGSRGGSGGGSGATGLAGGYNLDDLYDLINRQLAEYDNGYNTLMQNLLNAYNANFGSLNDSYLAALQALGLNYADTENLLNGRLANSQQALEDARKRAMQEAYISRMMDQKNLEDYLGAAGLSGGATESVLSSILNNYRNNRNKIEENTQTSLRELLQTYLDNMSNARQAYNSGLLNAENNRMSAAQNLANSLYESQANAASNYSNQRANVYNNLYDTLAKLALKG